MLSFLRSFLLLCPIVLILAACYCIAVVPYKQEVGQGVRGDSEDVWKGHLVQG